MPWAFALSDRPSGRFATREFGPAPWFVEPMRLWEIALLEAAFVLLPVGLHQVSQIVGAESLHLAEFVEVVVALWLVGLELEIGPSGFESYHLLKE